jgi:hypothetical protein
MAGQHKPLLRSFAGGEITPELYARLDLDKMQTGLAKALNFVVLPHGPAANRPGFQYVLEARANSTVRLIPFAYSVDQTMVLEFTEQRVRFHTNGGTLLEVAQALTVPYMTVANPGVFTIAGHGYSNGDWVYSTAISTVWPLYGRYLIVQNVTANTFTLTDLAGNAIDTSAFAVPAYLVTFARVYEVTTPYIASELMDLHYTQSADVLTLTHPSYAPRELRRLGATNWQLSTITFAPTIATPAIPTGVADASGGAGTPIDHEYVVTAVSGDNYEESLASPTLTLNNDLTVTGNSNEITPAAVAGAVRYNVYKLANGGLFGYIGQSDGTMFADDNIVPDLSQTPPEASTPFTGAGNYPSTVTYTEQRRCFAATDNKPQNVWMTRSATESNMSQSVPVRDNDAIVFRIAALQQNRIRHLVPLGDLIALTAGGEFRIYAAGSDVLTPASVTPKPQSYVGANNVQPAVAEASVLYVQGQGGHVREFAYAGDGINGALYKTNDISILAPHLFDGFDIVDLAYSRTAKAPTLWAVRDDGQLLGLTYVPSQNVRAWHQHNTDGGAFESVCCVTEGGEDVLYAAVRRTVNSREVVYVERLHTRTFSELEDAFFVDSGLTYDGSPTTAVSGLWHLIGETVSILADGAVMPTQVVSADGTLPDPLPVAASKVHVGKAITSNLRTLPLSWQADGFGQGVMKNISKVHVRLSQSSGVKIGPTDGRLVEVKQRTTEPYGSPPALMNGWRDTNIVPKWDEDGGLEITQTNPLPVMLVALVLDTVSGG